MLKIGKITLARSRKIMFNLVRDNILYNFSQSNFTKKTPKYIVFIFRGVTLRSIAFYFHLHVNLEVAICSACEPLLNIF